MAYICDICGKKSVAGRSQQHKRGIAGKRWKKRSQVTTRLFRPNLQKVTLIVGGVKDQWKICTKCLKRIKKFKSVREYSNITIA